mmetsp:Transcript_4973/g.22267  ORF Transcript_4973/g.22267 Transcript_4973/m.22267 type:complete len:297 (+) Transcript_4973:2469-3359(+)
MRGSQPRTLRRRRRAQQRRHLPVIHAEDVPVPQKLRGLEHEQRARRAAHRRLLPQRPHPRVHQHDARDPRVHLREHQTRGASERVPHRGDARQVHLPVQRAVGVPVGVHDPLERVRQVERSPPRVFVSEPPPVSRLRLHRHVVPAEIRGGPVGVQHERGVVGVIHRHDDVPPRRELLEQTGVLLLHAGEGVREEHEGEALGDAVQRGRRGGRVRHRDVHPRLHPDQPEVIHDPPRERERHRHRRRQRGLEPVRPLTPLPPPPTASLCLASVGDGDAIGNTDAAAGVGPGPAPLPVG